MYEFFENWDVILLRLILSAILGGLLGFERGKDQQNAGLRTYMLVGIGSATAMLTGEFMFLKYGTGDPARIGAQVVSGIGFLGAGSIIVSDRSPERVKGLTTAAGLWASACMGLAVGCGLYIAAVICTLLVYVIMKYLRKLEHHLMIKNPDLNIYLEVEPGTSLAYISREFKKSGFEIKELKLISEERDFDRMILSFSNNDKRLHDEIYRELKKIEGISFVQTMF